ncbi:amino acid deaminase/aldolase [Dictyobacter formicarum]|uniref:Amino acid aldolase n=1 Tax=Dictyobacter formicarum TaxID=2778368 RepID=A0ABQ3VMI7_9CHLR|nr:amino acid deaminase/aldolase [Dictyobacter formicarum]GHO87432.1 amino acid aldolase [Dictyobacter formicarum]
MNISTDPPARSPSQTQEPRDYQYYKKALAGRTFPLAYLDLDLLEQNIRAVAARAGGKRIRVASKSVRSVAALKRILAADPCFQGIMCFTAREAVYLASQGFDDLLLGYPTWHEQDISAVAEEIKQGTRITLMIDSVEHITRIEMVASRHEVTIPVCLDLDMALHLPKLHVGVWRSPLCTPDQMQPVLDSIAAAPHVLLDGIMGYEAQVAGVGDNYPKSAAKNAVVRYLKQRSIREAAARRAAAFDLIQSYILPPLRFVNGGGTGSIHTTRAEAAVTEITVGSGFYAPSLFDNYRDFRYQPAAGFALEIVRRATPTIYTCLGGGYIASGAVGRDKLPQPYLPTGARLEPLEGAGEVQTPIHYAGSEVLKPGDPILLRHSKAGELCERFNSLLLISNGAVIDEITTYRGDGQCFL